MSFLAALNALIGPIVWASHFLMVYASESLLCRAGAPTTHSGLVVVATLAALASLIWHGRSRLRASAPETKRHLAGIAAWLDVIGGVGIFLVSLAAVLPACRY